MTKPINYQAWALHENLDAYTAASLWCDRNPFYAHQWEHFEYVEVRNLVLQIIKHQLDAENYPIDKRNFVIIELGRRFDIGIDEFFNECKKFIVSRNQLKGIAKKCGVRPKFLFDYGSENEPLSKSSEMSNKNELSNKEIDESSKESQLQVKGNDGNSTKINIHSRGECINQEDSGFNDREVTSWLRETWNNEGKKGGTDFFRSLKNHVNKRGSPIKQFYLAGNDAGIEWESSAGATGNMTKKNNFK